MELMLFCILLLQGSTFTASVKITINPSMGDILLGESKAFICKVVDGEADDIVWVAPSEEEIEEGDNAGQRIAVSKEEYKSQLVITGATTADNGRYTCRASSDSGADTKKYVTINVIQDPVLTTRPIQEFREGWNAVIPCEAVGIPAPSVSWRFQGREIAPSGRFKVDDRGLLIDNVRTSDAGIYTCVGRIEDRNVETTLPIAVTVEFAPIFVTRDPEVVLSWVGNPVNISCTVQSHPRSEVVWRRNGTDLGSVGIIQFTGNTNEIRSTLQIQADSLEDFSSYSCVATNILGRKTYIVELREGGIPGPPRNLTVVSRSTDISGSFNPPEHDGGIPVLSYRVEWRENSRSEWNMKRIGNEYFQLFGLQPHTRYALRVSAINGRGIGNHSNPVYVWTPSLWKTDVPNVSASRGETGSSIRINFQKPENEDIPVTRYIIHYREFGDVQWVRAVGNCSDSVLLNDLHSATLYELKVQAESPEGLSPTVFLNATTAHKDPAASVGSRGKVGTVSVVAIILGTFLVIVAGVDAVCYRTRRCGIFMCLVSTLGRQRQSRGRLEPETGGESTR